MYLLVLNMKTQHSWSFNEIIVHRLSQYHTRIYEVNWNGFQTFLFLLLILALLYHKHALINHERFASEVSLHSVGPLKVHTTRKIIIILFP